MEESKDILDPREAIITKLDELVGIVRKYVTYAVEKGIRLPTEFATDPAAWAVVLRDIEYAFNAIVTDAQFGKVDEERRTRGWQYFNQYIDELYER